MKTKFKTLLATAAVSLAFPTSAKVTLPAFFTSGMVLQHNTVVSIPCKTTPGADVTVTLSLQSEKIELKADNEGKFTFRLEVPNASKQPFWIRFNDGETTLLNDLYSGEVWLCGGQSNMEMPVQGWGCVLNYEQEVANAAYPFIRLLQVSNTLAFSPQEDAAVNNGGWQVCSPATVANFSALAYFFGRELYKKLNVPIGLVYSAWGGTPCESWVSFETAKAVGGFESTLNMYEECNFDRDAILARDPGAEHFQKPTLEYNAMIYPLRIMPIAGAIWYQGENNCGAGDRQYAEKFGVLTQWWREAFRAPDAPFYYVLLAPHIYSDRMHRHNNGPATAETLPLFREQQKRGGELAGNCEYVCITDLVDDLRDIHPSYKWTVGDRLARVARAKAYSQGDVEWSGPRAVSASAAGGKVTVAFSHVADSLRASDGRRLGWFEVAGADGVFHPAAADITSDSTVAAFSIYVPQPRYVRFGWHETAQPNLENSCGLPAVPFGALEVRDDK